MFDVDMMNYESNQIFNGFGRNDRTFGSAVLFPMEKYYLGQGGDES